MGAEFNFETLKGKTAEEWLSENCQKWEAALIVQVIDGPYVMGAWRSS